MKLLISLLIVVVMLMLAGCDYLAPPKKAKVVPAPAADVVTILPVCPTPADVAKNARVDKIAKKAAHHPKKAKKVAPRGTKELRKPAEILQAP